MSNMALNRSFSFHAINHTGQPKTRKQNITYVPNSIQKEIQKKTALANTTRIWPDLVTFTTSTQEMGRALFLQPWRPHGYFFYESVHACHCKRDLSMYNVPFDTLQVILETSLSRKLIALVLTTKEKETKQYIHPKYKRVCSGQETAPEPTWGTELDRHWLETPQYHSNDRRTQTYWHNTSLVNNSSSSR